MNEWVQIQITALRSLKGLTVVRWIGIEMALRECGLDGLPDWNSESIPYLQLQRVDLILEGSQVAKILTYQNDDLWGICRKDDLDELSVLANCDRTSIFRRRELPELPTGQIDNVNVLTVDGEISELQLVLGRNHISLLAGEVHEHENGGLTISTPDESILVQLNGSRPNCSI